MKNSAPSIKEITETFKLGLLIGLLSMDQVINFADKYIEHEANPDAGIIEVSLSGSKGINETISKLEEVKGIYDIQKPIRTILGLIYIESLNSDDISEITYKLYSLSLNISESQIGGDLYFELNSMDDIKYLVTDEVIRKRIETSIGIYKELGEEFLKVLL
ncbi:hypothetical protein [Cohnella terricola]|uniref:Uncharacterized protein n=1 Tax=Cohnella terricola TaxID=1289167 RepID=A0A559IUT4_9BACL|nr:hypothetical protein [Cohnella terricola]TVX91389.1 hypothetical protein FPZ45_25095 [Cohnella terricola]